jgi:hypothetical protein
VASGRSGCLEVGADATAQRLVVIEAQLNQIEAQLQIVTTAPPTPAEPTPTWPEEWRSYY